MERELKRVKNGRCYLIPASEDTRGHGTTGMAKFCKKQLAGVAAVGTEAGELNPLGVANFVKPHALAAPAGSGFKFNTNCTGSRESNW